MDVLDLLDELDRRGVTLRLDHGRIIARPTSNLDDETRAAITAHRDLLAAIIRGRSTGHAPAPCTICGEVSLVAVATAEGKPRATWPTCRYTGACTSSVDVGGHGRHIPRPVDLERTAHRPAPAAKAPPAKPPTRRLLGPWPAWPTDRSARGAA